LPHLILFRLLAYAWSDGAWHLDLKARRRSAVCPCCRHRSTAVHSSYEHSGRASGGTATTLTDNLKA
jgi:hypothetical protein